MRPREHHEYIAARAIKGRHCMLREVRGVVITCYALDRRRGAATQTLRCGRWRLVEPNFNFLARSLYELNGAGPDSKMKTRKYINYKNRLPTPEKYLPPPCARSTSEVCAFRENAFVESVLYQIRG
jgi:hypothetical protein